MHCTSLNGKRITGMDKTSLDTSSRTLFVREGGMEGGREGRKEGGREGEDVHVTSSYVITYHCSA